jgi:hypothetical protein
LKIFGETLADKEWQYFMKKIGISILAVIFVLSLVACGNTAASGSYTGTVSAISADSITITTDDGQNLVIPITTDTVIARGDGHGGGPGGMGGGASSGDAPADGQAPSGDAPADGQAPSGDASADRPAPSGNAPQDGQAPSGDMPAATSGASMTQLTYSDIAVGDSVTVVVSDKGKAESISLGFGGDKNGAPQPSDSGTKN